MLGASGGLVPKLCLNLQPQDGTPPGSSVYEVSRILELVAIPSPGDLPEPGIEPASPALHADSFHGFTGRGSVA